MSLATRCTHCGTIFKVVQDQLKVSEGWVRCGRCHEVFNALPSLFDLEKDPPPPRPAHLAEPQDAPPQQALHVPEQVPEPAPGAAHQDIGASAEPPAAPPPPAPPQPPTPRAFTGLAAGVPIPLAAISEVGLPPAAPSPPAPFAAPPAPEARNPLIEQGLIAEADVELGFDSRPPSGWVPTQPAGIGRQPLDEEDLALDPAPIEATTDFELDTSIAVDDDTPLEAVLASMAPRQPAGTRPPPPAFEPVHPHEELPLRAMPAPRAWQDAPPPPEDLPTTEEEDALDSRYLMPSASRDRRPPRRLEEGPEFVDAQFPSDAFIDAEEDWASDFGPSALDADAPAPLAAPPSSTTPAAAGAPRVTPAPATPAERDASRGDEPPDSAPMTEGEEAIRVEDGDPPAKLRKRRGKRAASEAAEPEFLRHAQRKAFWRHPATRAALSLAGLALLAALGLQMAHQFRDLIAAYHPVSRPLLERMCEVARCEIKPPLHIEDLQVESATLVRAASDGPDSYRLAVVVHNKSRVGLAWPHVDLTLTDDNGAVIARRVFSPQDAQWLDTADAKADVSPDGQAAPATASTPPAAPGQRSTTLQWHLLAPDIKPAGYTAELFYP